MLGFGSPVASTQPADEATEIWARLKQAYSECETYRDSAVIELKNSRQSWRTQTSYRKNDRFTWSIALDKGGEKYHLTIVEKGDQTEVTTDVRRFEEILNLEAEHDVELAMALVYGLTRRLSNLVPQLLFPDKRLGWELFSPDSVESLEIVEDDGSLLWIKGVFFKKEMLFSIRKRDHLLLETRILDDHGNVEASAKYEPFLE
jgi:hypothetical protein